MAHFYFIGAHSEFLEGRGLIFSKLGKNFVSRISYNVAKHDKTQMYPKYFFILFLAQR